MDVFSLRSFCLAVAPISVHFITPPPLFAPVLCPHCEIPFLPLRYSFLFAKISPNVEFEGWGSGAVKLNHDMGYLIPHIPYGPLTPILAVHIAFSKCKTVFGKATVKINGEQAGWYFPIIAPFLICSDIVPLPLGQNVSIFWTTVMFGFSWGDFICGWLRIVAYMAVAFILYKIFHMRAVHGLVEALALRLADRLYKTIVSKLLFQLVGLFNYAVIQKLLELLPKEVAKKIVEKLAPKVSGGLGDPMEDLSRSIDEQLGDLPPPAPPATPPLPGMSSVPMAPGP